MELSFRFFQICERLLFSAPRSATKLRCPLPPCCTIVAAVSSPLQPNNCGSTAPTRWRCICIACAQVDIYDFDLYRSSLTSNQSADMCMHIFSPETCPDDSYHSKSADCQWVANLTTKGLGQSLSTASKWHLLRMTYTGRKVLLNSAQAPSVHHCATT